MAKHTQITIAGCGALFAGLLLFAGCRDGGGPDEEQQVPPVTVTDGNTAGPDTIVIPTVDPPTRESSSVTDKGCGTEGVDCTQPPPTTTTEPAETDEQPE